MGIIRTRKQVEKRDADIQAEPTINAGDSLSARSFAEKLVQMAQEVEKPGAVVKKKKPITVKKEPSKSPPRVKQETVSPAKVKVKVKAEVKRELSPSPAKAKVKIEPVSPKKKTKSKKKKKAAEEKKAEETKADEKKAEETKADEKKAEEKKKKSRSPGHAVLGLYAMDWMRRKVRREQVNAERPKRRNSTYPKRKRREMEE